jgi:hypothetical protein
MKNFYVALIEVETEKAGLPFVAAMNDLKIEGKKIGKVTYYEVKDEKQYRTAERDFAKQVG